MQHIDLSKNRAWIEIDLNRLKYNIIQFQNLLSSKTKIMAIVKADAYGCGDITISKELSKLGIQDFAVATLDEGIRLRENGICGNILILGYTSLDYLQYVIDYDLIQTIVDFNYSEQIKQINLKNKLKCHIKINTGMNRIGEISSNIEKIKSIYDNKNLDILGMFSHLCVADSDDRNNILFTNEQINKFNTCIEELTNNGYNVGKTHIQSSYGILNYNSQSYDYIRLGILMYGIDSSIDAYKNKNVNLKSVLSLKARIISIKNIDKGDSVGYGRTYIANENMKLATIGIGYADGVFRNLSNNDMYVKVKNAYAPIIGRICMDQLMIDITNIQDVNVGDIVSLIDDDEKISIEMMALKSNTVTHEILSRLGKRLPRIYIT